MEYNEYFTYIDKLKIKKKFVLYFYFPFGERGHFPEFKILFRRVWWWELWAMVFLD